MAALRGDEWIWVVNGARGTYAEAEHDCVRVVVG